MRETFVDPQRAADQSSVVGYKDIIVHLDGTLEDEIRLAHGEATASLFNAHLTGVYTNSLPDIALYSAPASMMAYVELEIRFAPMEKLFEKGWPNVFSS